MGKFLFIPPVDDSVPPLTARQWTILTASFLVSLILVVLAQFMHGVLSVALMLAIVITAVPMQIYSLNRKGRLVGKIFLTVFFSIILYERWNWINTHAFSSVMFVFALLCVVWLTWCIDQAGNLILKRLAIMQRRVNSIELKLDHLERALRKEAAEIGETNVK